MKFVVDAHLPRRLCGVPANHGHEAVHTLDLPAGNSTSDEAINRISLDDRRVVISKDTDFFFSHTLHGRPRKLLLVKIGNISTRDLCVLPERNRRAIEAALESHTLVEIDRLAVKPVA